jgi:hypothetical protein
MTDYKALVDEMRLKGQPPQHLGNRLADAVEALVREVKFKKARIRGAVSDYEAECTRADRAEAERDALRAENDRLRVMWDQSGKNDLIAERDALRAQLDNMTTEWGLRDNKTGFVYGPYKHEPQHGDYYTKMSRLVSGPWLEVTD